MGVIVRVGIIVRVGVIVRVVVIVGFGVIVRFGVIVGVGVIVRVGVRMCCVRCVAVAAVRCRCRRRKIFRMNSASSQRSVPSPYQLSTVGSSFTISAKYSS